MSLKTDLIARVRRLIDRGKWAKDSNTADGSSTYYVDNFPVFVSNVTIIAGGITKTLTTDYTLDTDIGEITWVNVPASGVSLVIKYKYYKYSDTDIWDYIINEGIDDLKIIDNGLVFDYLSGTDTLNPVPDDDQKYCISLATAIVMRREDENSALGNSIKVREGDVSIDTSVGGERIKSVERWEEKLKEIIRSKKFNDMTGSRVSLYTNDLYESDTYGQ